MVHVVLEAEDSPLDIIEDDTKQEISSDFIYGRGLGRGLLFYVCEGINYRALKERLLDCPSDGLHGSLSQL